MSDITSEASTRASADTNLQNQVNSLNSSVSNGKTQVANAITGKGVSASGSDSFATLANKISQISASSWYESFNINVSSASGQMATYVLNTTRYNYILVTAYTGSSASYVRIAAIKDGSLTNIFSHGRAEIYNVAMSISGNTLSFGPGYDRYTVCYLSTMPFAK